MKCLEIPEKNLKINIKKELDVQKPGSGGSNMFLIEKSLHFPLGAVSSLQKNYFNENLGSYQQKCLRVKLNTLAEEDFLSEK